VLVAVIVAVGVLEGKAEPVSGKQTGQNEKIWVSFYLLDQLGIDSSILS
jgi:hypothetical protein